MNSLTDTHYYDHKLKILVEKIKDKYPANICLDEAIKWVQKVNTECKFKDKHHVEISLNLIKKSAQFDNGNYDNGNCANAADLLCRIVPYVKTWDTSAYIILLEQLADISMSGSCPQGRCTRLIQLFD